MPAAPPRGPHDVALTADQEGALRKYAALLYEEGEALGLLGPNEAERIWDRHILDSLTCAEWIDPSSRARVADVGSGPGLPGIPVAAARPLARVVLIDSRRRRCDWALRTCEALGVHAEVLCQRVEETGRGAMRGTFDHAISRAFASVAVLLECSLPLLAAGGTIVALRGVPNDEEKRAADFASSVLGGGPPQWTPRSGGSGAAGSVLVVEKTGATPEEFPRRPGIPAKRPLRPPPDSGTMPFDPGEAPNG
jgi:16S rRNA (guanine527-N7)-methyltransferase